MTASNKLRGFLHIIVHGVEDLSVKDNAQLPPHVVHLQVAGQEHYMNIRQGDWAEPVSFQIGSFLPAFNFRSFMKAARTPARQTANARRPSLGDVEAKYGISMNGMKKVVSKESMYEEGYATPVSSVQELEKEKPLPQGKKEDDIDLRVHVEVLEISLSKSDGLSVLGRNELSQDEITAKADTWCTRRLELETSMDEDEAGFIGLSYCWEPAQFLPLYLMRIGSVMSFCSSFGLLCVSTSCRWQKKPGISDKQQPGVAGALALASFTMACATIVHFLVAHMGDAVHLNSLAAVSSRQLAAGMRGQTTAPGVLLRARATNVLRGEVEVMPNIDMRIIYLPLVALAWMTPLAGFSLTIMAMLLQLQDWSLDFWCAGEIMAILSIVCTVFGYLCAAVADAQPRSKQSAAQYVPEKRQHAAAAVGSRLRRWAAHIWNNPPGSQLMSELVSPRSPPKERQDRFDRKADVRNGQNPLYTPLRS